MGCLAGEIGFDRKKYFWSFAIAMVLDWIGYFIPLWGALTESYTSTDWYLGYFLYVYNRILNGLAYPIIIGGFLSNFGMYNIELSVHGRSVWAISQQSIIILPNGQLHLDHEIVHHNQEDLRHIRVDILPDWLVGTIWQRTGSPARAIILQSLVCCFLVIFDFDVLVEAAIFIKCFAWLFEFFAFVKLRYTEPDVERPFKVPGGMFGAWLITITKVLVILAVFITVVMEEYYICIGTLAFYVVIIIWYYIRKYQWAKNEYTTVPVNDDNDNTITDNDNIAL